MFWCYQIYTTYNISKLIFSSFWCYLSFSRELIVFKICPTIDAFMRWGRLKLRNYPTLLYVSSLSHFPLKEFCLGLSQVSASPADRTSVTSWILISYITIRGAPPAQRAASSEDWRTSRQTTRRWWITQGGKGQHEGDSSAPNTSLVKTCHTHSRGLFR